MTAVLSVSQPPELGHLVSIPTGKPPLPAVDVDGTDLFGRPVTVQLKTSGRPWTLVLFLGSRCDGCLPFWPLADAPLELGLAADDAVLIVTRGPGAEDPEHLAQTVRPSSGGDLSRTPQRIVMSDRAWDVYQVHGPPFFVLVDGERVATEGVAWSVEQVAADVARARWRVRR